MAQPHLLLVDDSPAILALEAAALEGTYRLSTAADGREALTKMRHLRPTMVLLDLTMPQMGGEEVLRHMAAEPGLSKIPVIVVSSEKERAPRCLQLGARDFVAKPVQAAHLVAVVARVLRELRGEEEQPDFPAIFVTVGALEMGLPIGCVRSVLHQVATRPFPVGPAYLNELAEVHGEPLLVLDLARRLGVAHERPMEERKLVVVEVGDSALALCVDSVRDPEEIPGGNVVPRSRLAGSEHGSLPVALLGMARTARGPVPLLDPAALVTPTLLGELSRAVPALPRAGAA